MKRPTGVLLALLCSSSLAIAQGGPDRGGDRGGGDGGGFSRGGGGGECAEEVVVNADSAVVGERSFGGVGAPSAARRSRAPSGRLQAVPSAPSRVGAAGAVRAP